MADQELRRLQLEELDILNEFIRVCEEHGFRYYLLGGTLLGAVRHQGFIPWDDDVDVCMPREDYEKFIRLKRENFQKKYFMQMYQKKTSRYAWARLVTKNLKVINQMANLPREEYAWIDIIPLDGMPDGAVERMIHKWKLSFWWNLNQIVQFDELVDQKRKRGTIGKLAVKAASGFRFLGKLIDYRVLLHHLNNELMKYPYDSDTKEVINFLAAYGFKETFRREAFAETEKYDFEGIMMVGPKDADHVLSTIYGSYMELPPEEDRNKHHLTIVE